MIAIAQKVCRAQWLRVVGRFAKEPVFVRAELARHLRGLGDSYCEGLADHLTDGMRGVPSK